MLVVQSEGLDPYTNLALEEALLENVETNGETLFFWVSHPCVVLGKNQNPWVEANLQDMERDNIALTRRCSGGGTVYHDAGNLNLSLMRPRADYEASTCYEVMIRVLAQLGIEAEREGPNSLFASGRKISGHAFCLRKNVSLHHATLLVDADLERVGHYLGSGLNVLSSRAIASVPAEVTNLSTSRPGLAMDEVLGALAQGFSGQADVTRHAPTGRCDPGVLKELEEKHRSWEWVYGHTPMFEVEQAGAVLKVNRGTIREVQDGPETLIGSRFRPAGS